MIQKQRPTRLYCAIDSVDLDHTLDLAGRLAGVVDGLKLGLEFFLSQGPAGVARVGQAGLPVFLDLKLHDIPNTVAGGVRAVAPLQPAFLTIHAAGGADMMRRAATEAGEQASRLGGQRPTLLGVTVMTSLDEADLRATGITGDPQAQVQRLAGLALDAGLDGIVCSARELALLRDKLGPDPVLVVPGIRPAGSDADDQKRIMTPAEAVAAGADILVVGRPITRADDPAGAARAIRAEVADGR